MGNGSDSLVCLVQVPVFQMTNKIEFTGKRGVVHSTIDDPWYNLAFEEYLLNNVEQGQVIFYLWQNQNTVVIGRNQNAWKECRHQLLAEQGGKLARRLSGGGAVFHDLGNLNFTFILDKELYDLEKQLSVILRAVRKQGIDAEFSGRNDLVVKGKKFSGNAFYLGDEFAYHHGTVMVNTDFRKLVRYLQVSPEKIESKGVDSVRSRVLNLKELKPELTIDGIKQALSESFAEIYGEVKQEFSCDPREVEGVAELYDRYSSWEWRFGRTPDFDITFDRRFDWGDIELGLTLKQGHVEEATIYSDAMNSQLIQEIAGAIEGAPFKMEEIIKKIEAVETDGEESQIIRDITGWLQTKSL